MTRLTKILVCVVVAGAAASLHSAWGHPGQQWPHFFVYLAAILLSSGMKVAMPKSDGTMSVNFPFILLGLVQLSPLQAIMLAAASVIVLCRINVVKSFTLVQIVFNVANVITATFIASNAYKHALPLVHGEVAPALAIAAAIYFLANTLPLALVLGWESGASPLVKWRQEFPWYFPFYLVGALLAATADFIGNRYGWLTSMLLIPLVYTVYRAYRAQMAIIRDRERHITEIEALHLRTIEGLSMAIEAKDRNTHSHLMRVRVYATELGKIVGLSEPQMKALVTASYLHDIGKLAVPEHIIDKPGKLTPEEFEKIKIHPVVGADILKRVQFPYPVVPIVRAHHEAWDGSGYPDGLKGEEIPIGARILTVVDCFDALASERPYRKALPLDEAIAVVMAKAGSQFDPVVAGLLEEHYPRLERMARQEIEEMAPLKTDLLVERGAAPGAGFEPEAAKQNGGERARAANVSGGDVRGAQPLLAGAANAGAPEDEAISALGDVRRGARTTGEEIAGSLQPLIPFDCFALYLRQGECVYAAYINGPFDYAFTTQPILLGEGLSGWVAMHQRPIVNGNPTVEPNLHAAYRLFMADSSALAVPLLDGLGSVFAVVTLYARQHAAFSKDHLRLLEDMAPEWAFSLAQMTHAQAGKTETDRQASNTTEAALQGARSK
jgi:putative nucleotidyltransferase with HDIG domain